MGRSMAMVGTGPIPGRTPISVPSRQPRRQYARFSSVRATENPRAKCSSNSINGSYLDKARPEGEHQAQALDEGEPYEDDQADGVDEGDFPAEFMAGEAAYHDEQEYRYVDTDHVQNDAGKNDGTNDDAENAEVKAFDFGFFGLFLQGRKGDPRSKNGKAEAKPEWEVAGAHASGRTHGVARSTKRESNTKWHVHDSGPEVMLISKLYVD